LDATAAQDGGTQSGAREEQSWTSKVMAEERRTEEAKPPPSAAAPLVSRKEDSAIIFDSETQTRRGHATHLWPETTFTDPRKPDMNFVYWEGGAFLAMEEFNAHSGAILPNLPRLLEGCAFEFDLDFRDTRLRAFKAVKELEDSFVFGPNQEGAPNKPNKPFAAVGGYASGVSIPMSLLAAGLELPVISGQSNSKDLDSRQVFAFDFGSLNSC